MKKFYTRVVNNPKKIIVSFIIAALICLFLRGMVSVNYDFTDYLPADSPSTVSISIMNSEFDSKIPNARVMIEDVTIPQALEYKEKLQNCEGVTKVSWLDDAANILQPIETLDQKTVRNYYKDKTALFTVTVAQEKLIQAVSAMRAVVGEDNAMGGDAVTAAIATVGSVIEIRIIAIFSVAFVLLVLILTTYSWIQPLIILTGLGVAIIINAGSNLIFGEISFVTNAAGNILQLAVSLDYSVFLIHRFEECLKENNSPKKAMVEALSKSARSILSSGLTTVTGFLALVFMRFGIGSDLGVALAKGTAISLITVFIFMPVLILTTNKWVDKTRHGKLIPSFQGFGKVVSRMMIPLACIFVLMIVPAFLSSNANSFYFGASQIYGVETQLGRDNAAIEEVFGKNDTYVVMVPRGDTAKEQQLSDALHEIAQVKNIISYVDTVGAEIPAEYLDDDTLSQLVSDHYSRMILTVDADYEGDETFRLIETVRDTVNAYYPGSYYLTGQGISTYDLAQTITDDMVKVNLIAIIAVFFVLLLTMRSLVLPVILLLSIETAIWLNLSIPYFLGSPVFYISYLIISSIQLGATVDYAILFTDRYMENRQSMDKIRAIIETARAVTTSLLTTGTVLAVVGFLLGRISTHGIISQLGMFLCFGSLLSLGTVLFVLPGLLYLLDGLIRKTSFRPNFYQKPKENIK